ncbi:hypothetical protein MMPV_007183 [Pyropia vietnamensis]
MLHGPPPRNGLAASLSATPAAGVIRPATFSLPLAASASAPQLDEGGGGAPAVGDGGGAASGPSATPVQTPDFRRRGSAARLPSPLSLSTASSPGGRPLAPLASAPLRTATAAPAPLPLSTASPAERPAQAGTSASAARGTLPAPTRLVSSTPRREAGSAARRLRARRVSSSGSPASSADVALAAESAAATTTAAATSADGGWDAADSGWDVVPAPISPQVSVTGTPVRRFGSRSPASLSTRGALAASEAVAKAADDGWGAAEEAWDLVSPAPAPSRAMAAGSPSSQLSRSGGSTGTTSPSPQAAARRLSAGGRSPPISAAAAEDGWGAAEEAWDLVSPAAAPTRRVAAESPSPQRSRGGGSTSTTSPSPQATARRLSAGGRSASISAAAAEDGWGADEGAWDLVSPVAAPALPATPASTMKSISVSPTGAGAAAASSRSRPVVSRLGASARRHRPGITRRGGSMGAASATPSQRDEGAVGRGSSGEVPEPLAAPTPPTAAATEDGRTAAPVPTSLDRGGRGENDSAASPNLAAVEPAAAVPQVASTEQAVVGDRGSHLPTQVATFSETAAASGVGGPPSPVSKSPADPGVPSADEPAADSSDGNWDAVPAVASAESVSIKVPAGEPSDKPDASLLPSAAPADECVPASSDPADGSPSDAVADGRSDVVQKDADLTAVAAPTRRATEMIAADTADFVTLRAPSEPAMPLTCLTSADSAVPTVTDAVGATVLAGVAPAEASAHLWQKQKPVVPHTTDTPAAEEAAHAGRDVNWGSSPTVAETLASAGEVDASTARSGPKSLSAEAQSSGAEPAKSVRDAEQDGFPTVSEAAAFSVVADAVGSRDVSVPVPTSSPQPRATEQTCVETADDVWDGDWGEAPAAAVDEIAEAVHSQEPAVAEDVATFTRDCDTTSATASATEQELVESSSFGTNALLAGGSGADLDGASSLAVEAPTNEMDELDVDDELAAAASIERSLDGAGDTQLASSGEDSRTALVVPMVAPVELASDEAGAGDSSSTELPGALVVSPPAGETLSEAAAILEEGHPVSSAPDEPSTALVANIPLASSSGNVAAVLATSTDTHVNLGDGTAVQGANSSVVPVFVADADAGSRAHVDVAVPVAADSAASVQDDGTAESDSGKEAAERCTDDSKSQSSGALEGSPGADAKRLLDRPSDGGLEGVSGTRGPPNDDVAIAMAKHGGLAAAASVSTDAGLPAGGPNDSADESNTTVIVHSPRTSCAAIGFASSDEDRLSGAGQPPKSPSGARPRDADSGVRTDASALLPMLPTDVAASSSVSAAFVVGDPVAGMVGGSLSLEESAAAAAESVSPLQDKTVRPLDNEVAGDVSKPRKADESSSGLLSSTDADEHLDAQAGVAAATEAGWGVEDDAWEPVGAADSADVVAANTSEVAPVHSETSPVLAGSSSTTSTKLVTGSAVLPQDEDVAASAAPRCASGDDASSRALDATPDGDGWGAADDEWDLVPTDTQATGVSIHATSALKGSDTPAGAIADDSHVAGADDDGAAGADDDGAAGADDDGAAGADDDGAAGADDNGAAGADDCCATAADDSGAAASAAVIEPTFMPIEEQLNPAQDLSGPPVAVANEAADAESALLGHRSTVETLPSASVMKTLTAAQEPVVDGWDGANEGWGAEDEDWNLAIPGDETRADADSDPAGLHRTSREDPPTAPGSEAKTNDWQVTNDTTNAVGHKPPVSSAAEAAPVSSEVGSAEFVGFGDADSEWDLSSPTTDALVSGVTAGAAHESGSRADASRAADPVTAAAPGASESLTLVNEDEALGLEDDGWGALAPGEEELLDEFPAAAATRLDANDVLHGVVSATAPLAAAAVTWAQSHGFASTAPASLPVEPAAAVEPEEEEGPSAAEFFLEQQQVGDKAEDLADGPSAADLDDSWILADLASETASDKAVMDEAGANMLGSPQSPGVSSGRRDDAYGTDGDTGTVRVYGTSGAGGSVANDDSCVFGLDDSAFEEAEAAATTQDSSSMRLPSQVQLAPQQFEPSTFVPDSEIVAVPTPHQLSPATLGSSAVGPPPIPSLGAGSPVLGAQQPPPPPADLFVPSGLVSPSAVAAAAVLLPGQESPATPLDHRCRVTFGFGGSVTVTAAPRPSSDLWAPRDAASLPHTVRVYAVRDVVPVSASVDIEAALEAVAPSGAAASTREVYVPLCERMAARASSTEAATLWRVLGLAVRRPGEWRTDEAVGDLATVLAGPTSSALLGSRLPAAASTRTGPLLPFDREDEPLLRNRAGRVQSLVASGRVADAQALASDGDLWPLALILGSATGVTGGGGATGVVRSFPDVVRAFAAASFSENSSLRTLCEVAAGGPISGASTDSWAKSAAALVGMRRRAGIRELAHGGGEARAHVCRLVCEATGGSDDPFVAAACAGSPVLLGGLGGAPGASTSAMLATLVWEASEAAAVDASRAAAAAAGGGPTKDVTIPGGMLFPSLLPYRLQLASAVAAVGRLEAAKEHVAAIIAGVREAVARSGGGPPPGGHLFLGALRDLELRLATAEAGRRPPPPADVAGKSKATGDGRWKSALFSSSSAAASTTAPSAAGSDDGRTGGVSRPRRLDGLLDSTVKALIGAGDEAANGQSGGGDAFPVGFAPLGGVPPPVAAAAPAGTPDDDGGWAAAGAATGRGFLPAGTDGSGFVSVGRPPVGPAPARAAAAVPAIAPSPWDVDPAGYVPTPPGGAAPGGAANDPPGGFAVVAGGGDDGGWGAAAVTDGAAGWQQPTSIPGMGAVGSSPGWMAPLTSVQGLATAATPPGWAAPPVSSATVAGGTAPGGWPAPPQANNVGETGTVAAGEGWPTASLDVTTDGDGAGAKGGWPSTTAPGGPEADAAAGGGAPGWPAVQPTGAVDAGGAQGWPAQPDTAADPSGAQRWLAQPSTATDAGGAQGWPAQPHTAADMGGAQEWLAQPSAAANPNGAQAWPETQPDAAEEAGGAQGWVAQSDAAVDTSGARGWRALQPDTATDATGAARWSGTTPAVVNPTGSSPSVWPAQQPHSSVRADTLSGWPPAPTDSATPWEWAAAAQVGDPAGVSAASGRLTSEQGATPTADGMTGWAAPASAASPAAADTAAPHGWAPAAVGASGAVADEGAAGWPAPHPAWDAAVAASHPVEPPSIAGGGDGGGLGSGGGIGGNEFGGDDKGSGGHAGGSNSAGAPSWPVQAAWPAPAAEADTGRPPVGSVGGFEGGGGGAAAPTGGGLPPPLSDPPSRGERSLSRGSSPVLTPTATTDGGGGGRRQGRERAASAAAAHTKTDAAPADRSAARAARRRSSSWGSFTERLRTALAKRAGVKTAHMGEENQFVYDEARGRWVLEGEDDGADADAPPPLPPPPSFVQAAVRGDAGGDGGDGGAGGGVPVAAAGTAVTGRPPTMSTAGTPLAPSGSLPPRGAGGAGNLYSAGRRAGARSRYVDTLGGGVRGEGGGDGRASAAAGRPGAPLAGGGGRPPLPVASATTPIRAPSPLGGGLLPPPPPGGGGAAAGGGGGREEGDSPWHTFVPPRPAASAVATTSVATPVASVATPLSAAAPSSAAAAAATAAAPPPRRAAAAGP